MGRARREAGGVRILVYLRDGRTVYLLEKRSTLNKLVNGGEPWHENESISVVRGIWNPEAREYVWKAIPLRYIAKASISVVEEARGIADVPPLEAAE
jgi:hypothetical protein